MKPSVNRHGIVGVVHISLFYVILDIAYRVTLLGKRFVPGQALCLWATHWPFAGAPLEGSDFSLSLISEI